MKHLLLIAVLCGIAGCTEPKAKTYERGYKDGRADVEKRMTAEVTAREAEIAKLKARLGFLPEALSTQPCCKFKKHEIQVGDPVRMNYEFSDIYKQIRHVESIDGKSVTLCDGSMTDIHWLSYAGESK